MIKRYYLFIDIFFLLTLCKFILVEVIKTSGAAIVVLLFLLLVSQLSRLTCDFFIGTLQVTCWILV